MADWGVIVSQPQRHWIAKQSLAASGFEYFLPQYETVMVRRGRHERRKYPLFGRYILFVVDDRWRQLFSLNGITGMILSSDRSYPAIISSEELERIRSCCVTDDVYRERELVVGENVTPRCGPWKDFVGPYDGGEAAVFQLFGQPVRVVFDVGVLKAA
jgi:transcription antitermination factor NusG